MDELAFVKRDIQDMYSFHTKSWGKYNRNLNYYHNFPVRRDSIWNLYNQPQGYNILMDASGTGSRTSINILKSVVDTMVSKMAQIKVRPFINPVNGNWSTRKAVKNAQIYFDEYFTHKNVYSKAIRRYKDALIFDVGWLAVDDLTGKVTNPRPWEVLCDVAEFHYGKLTKGAIIKMSYPLVNLYDDLGEELPEKYKQDLKENPSKKVDYTIYWNTYLKKRYDFISGEKIHESEYDRKRVPISPIFYNDPLKGFFTTSGLDDIITIQMQINDLWRRIDDATRTGLISTIFLAENAGIKETTMSNQANIIVTHKQLPGVTNPVTIMTPNPISDQYLQISNMLEQKAYNIFGVSQLSAQSQKPKGADSGVSLQTLEDVESDRFEVQLQNYIAGLMDIAEIITECSPDSKTILPVKSGRSKVTWKDLRKEKDLYTFQFSAASALSKDPSVKLEQIEKLAQYGVIDQAMFSSLMDMPDLEGAYSISTSNYDWASRIIERCIEDGKTDFNELGDLNLLLRETIHTYIRLDANEENEKVLYNLEQLLNKIKETIDKVQAFNTPAPAPLNAAPMAGNMPLQQGQVL